MEWLRVPVGVGIALFALAVLTRDWRSIALAGLLAAINVGLIVPGLAGAAAEAAPDSKRFLRVATFNLWFENERIDEVDTFLNQTDADVVTLQEVTDEHLAALHKGLDARCPYSVGDFGIVIFSKYAIKADGRVDRAGYPESLRLLARWVELDVHGTAVEVVGVHCAEPFHPLLQAQDVAALTQLVLTRTLPIVVAGDFNLTPWTDHLKQFTRMTGLGRFNTLILTSCRWSPSTMCSPRRSSPRSPHWAARGRLRITGRLLPTSPSRPARSPRIEAGARRSHSLPSWLRAWR
jgi:endonuclease/exonuclease/phosphatase (EEP) superfamily protein YafD